MLNALFNNFSKKNAGRYVFQGLAYAAFMAVIGYFSTAPTYRHQPEHLATIKLSLRHSGQLLGQCQQRSAQQLSQLPAHAQAPQICPRERSALLLEMDLNHQPVLSELLQPSGLHKDGMAVIYRRLTVPAGDLEVTVRLKDQITAEGFPYQAQHKVTLKPAQVLVIDFDSNKKHFVFL